MGLIPSVAAVDIPSVLRDFHRQYPDVRISSRVGASEELVEQVKKVPLWFSSSRCCGGWLVEGAIAEHGEQDVDAATGEADEGCDVVFSLASLPVVVGA